MPAHPGASSNNRGDHSRRRSDSESVCETCRTCQNDQESYRPLAMPSPGYTWEFIGIYFVRSILESIIWMSPLRCILPNQKDWVARFQFAITSACANSSLFLTDYSRVPRTFIWNSAPTSAGIQNFAAARVEQVRDSIRKWAATPFQTRVVCSTPRNISFQKGAALLASKPSLSLNILLQYNDLNHSFSRLQSSTIAFRTPANHAYDNDNSVDMVKRQPVNPDMTHPDSHRQRRLLILVRTTPSTSMIHVSQSYKLIKYSDVFVTPSLY